MRYKNKYYIHRLYKFYKKKKQKVTRKIANASKKSNLQLACCKLQKSLRLNVFRDSW